MSNQNQCFKINSKCLSNQNNSVSMMAVITPYKQATTYKSFTGYCFKQ